MHRFKNPQEYVTGPIFPLKLVSTNDANDHDDEKKLQIRKAFTLGLKNYNSGDTESGIWERVFREGERVRGLQDKRKKKKRKSPQVC